MNRRKLNKLKRKLAALRRSSQKAAALERFASKPGRELVNRGKEPMWESVEFDHLFPLQFLITAAVEIWRSELKTAS